MIDKMMKEKITIFNYITRITGHNIQQFLVGQYELIDYRPILSKKLEKGIGKKNITEKHYYLKYKITYKNKKSNKMIKNKLIEIDIIKESKKYKVFGFII